MKEKDGYVNCPEQQVILYVEKENGQYGPIQTGSYLSGNYLDDYEMKRVHLEESLRQQVLKGEISLVRYYMVLEDLTISELASRVGLSKSKVRQHLDPVRFGRVRLETLKKYAEVFNVPLPAFGTGGDAEKRDHLESYMVLEERKQVEGIEHGKTNNPYVNARKSRRGKQMTTVPFKHKMAAHCESGSITSLLNNAGLDITEPMVFGISSGIFFGYLRKMKSFSFPDIHRQEQARTNA